MDIQTVPGVGEGLTPGRRASRKAGEFAKYWKFRHLTILLFPGIVYYVVFHYVPIYGLQIAFKDFIITKGIWRSPWVGVRNFTDLFAYGSFWEVLRNTVVISAYKLVFGFPLPIAFAILLNEIRHKYFKKTIQTISYLPHFISWVVLAGLFMQFLSPSTGPVNIILKSIGIRPIYFLADPSWFRSVLVGTSLWKGVGWGSIIYLAALSNINPELYETAVIDGANRFQRMLHVTLPSIVPLITIMLIFSLRGIISDDFDQIFNLYNPAVYSVADVLSTYMYRVGLVGMEYSLGAALGLFRNLIAFVFVVVANSIARRLNEYAIW